MASLDGLGNQLQTLTKIDMREGARSNTVKLQAIAKLMRDIKSRMAWQL